MKVYTLDLYSDKHTLDYPIHLDNVDEHAEDYYDNLSVRHFSLNQKFYNKIVHQDLRDSCFNRSRQNVENVETGVYF